MSFSKMTRKFDSQKLTEVGRSAYKDPVGVNLVLRRVNKTEVLGPNDKH